MFYGPKVPASYQYGPAMNTTFLPRLSISTFSAALVNNPADPGLRMLNNANNAVPPQPALAIDTCNDNAGLSPDALAARITLSPLSTSTDRNIAAYRLVLLYKGTPPLNAKVTWTWIYF